MWKVKVKANDNWYWLNEAGYLIESMVLREDDEMVEIPLKQEPKIASNLSEIGRILARIEDAHHFVKEIRIYPT